MEKMRVHDPRLRTLGGKFSRRQTGTADWDEAKSVVALLQQSGSWDGQATPVYKKLSRIWSELSARL
jgi:hypothetical protein